MAVITDSRQVTDNGKTIYRYGLELRESATYRLIYQLQQNDPEQGKVVTSFVFSPDGIQLAVGSQDNRVRVWDTENGKLLYEVEHDSNVNSVVYSPDGKVLASASEDATVRFWDTQTGKNLFTLRGFEQGIQYVAYVNQGSRLLIGFQGDNTFLEYILGDQYLPTKPLDIRMEPGKELHPLYSSSIYPKIEIIVSPNTRQMAVLLNAKIQLWDLDRENLILTMPDYTGKTFTLEFNPGNDILAVADHDIHLWEVSTHKYLTTFDVESSEIFDLAFRPDGKLLAVAVAEWKVEIWDVFTRQKLRDIEPGCSATRLSYSQDGGKLVIACWRDIQIWDLETNVRQQRFESEIGDPDQVSFSEDGQRLFLITEKHIQGWDIASGVQLYAPETTGYDYLNSTGLNIDLAMFGNRDSPLMFFDPITGQHLYDFANREDTDIAALSPDGRLLAWSNHSRIDLVDASSGQDYLSVDYSDPLIISISPNNRFMAARSYDYVVHLWDISAAGRLAAVAPLNTATPAPTFTPTPTQTKELIAPIMLTPFTPPTLAPGAIRPENIDQLEKQGELGLGEARVTAWSPDGKILVIVSSPGVYLYNMGAAKPSLFLPAEGMLELFVFSPDGRLIAGRTRLYSIQVWEVSTGHSLFKIQNTGCWNYILGFDQENQFLTTNCGGVTYRWNIPNGQLISKDNENIPYSYTSPDGSMTLKYERDSIRLLATGSLEIIKTFDVPGMAPALAEFSPDGKTLLVWFYKFEIARSGAYVPGNSPSSLIQLWNITPGEDPTLRASLQAARWAPDSLAVTISSEMVNFSPDNRRLVTASGDGQVQIWDMYSGKLQATLPDGKWIHISPDGSHLAVLGETVKVWDITPQQEPRVIWELHGFSKPAFLLRFIHGSNQLMAASDNRFLVWQWAGTNYTEYPTIIEAPGAVWRGLASSPDGKWLAYNSSDKLFIGKNNPTNPDWQMLIPFNDPQDLVFSRALAFSPDSSLLAAANPDRKVLLWRLEQLASPPIELASNIIINNLVFSPDGKWLMGFNTNATLATLYLWNTRTGDLIRSWEMNADQIAIHPDGVTLGTTDYQNGKIRLIDLHNAEVIREMQGNPYAYEIAFSPDGSLLVANTAKKIQIWEVASGKLLRELTGNFTTFDFSSDGKILALGLSDGRIEYWGIPFK